MIGDNISVTHADESVPVAPPGINSLYYTRSH